MFNADHLLVKVHLPLPALAAQRGAAKTCLQGTPVIRFDFVGRTWRNLRPVRQQNALSENSSAARCFGAQFSTSSGRFQASSQVCRPELQVGVGSHRFYGNMQLFSRTPVNIQRQSQHDSAALPAWLSRPILRGNRLSGNV